MITQIEIDGFKTFKDFKVELAPFQVIVGLNGSGKSNLFDALQLLSRLAEMDVDHAFEGLRGGSDEALTKSTENKAITIAVEMLVDDMVRDRWKRESPIHHKRLRYEIHIAWETDELKTEQPYIAYEGLKPISKDKDSWCLKYTPFFTNSYVSTSVEHEELSYIFTRFDITTYHPFPPEKATRKTQMRQATRICLRLENIEDTDAIEAFPEGIKQAVLSSVNNANQTPHALVVQQELQQLRLLNLRPEALRQPSAVKAPSTLTSSGGNLPTTLARMQAEDQFALHDVSLDMASLVPDFSGIEVRKDDVRNEYTLWATYVDGRTFSSRVLSDGTLQLLALATLKNDPHFHGVLCFEEPENGVNPAYLANIARLLRGLATDFSDPQQREEPLRQVLVTTHSPAFITQPDAFNALLYMYTVTQVSPQATGIPPMRVTQATPVLVSGQATDTTIDKQQASYTLAFVRDLLANDHTGEAIQRINESRAKLNKQN